VWTLEKRQLLVDSILNGYDIPKIYFHKFSTPKKVARQEYDYAIIDGKQRLETLWRFINGEFTLSNGFEYLHDSSVEAAGFDYNELAQRYPRLKIRFDSFSLSIVTIETDDEELIEDMFSRLNEAVPLSAAEKRNALGGPIPKEIRRLAESAFYRQCIPFSNSRYRHYDLAAKMLFIESEQKVVDTKKAYLDEFVKKWKSHSPAEAKKLKAASASVTDVMAKTFNRSDPLLKSIAMVTAYYYVFHIAIAEGWVEEVSRNRFLKFEEQRKENRVTAETDLTSAEYDLIEFDRYAQTPNDYYANEIRLKIILERVFGRRKKEASLASTSIRRTKRLGKVTAKA
jgi:hypothetical protein